MSKDTHPVLWIALAVTLAVLLFGLTGCAHNDGMGDLYKGVGRVLN